MDVPAALAALQRRARTEGAEPLLTHYDLAGGGRTELSVATFANWVNKTANLIEDVGADAGQVGLPLATSRPGHWMTLIWPLAAWQRECTVGPSADHADVAVVGPDDSQPIVPDATFACSLHPLGLGLRDLPPGVLDYTTEALAQPDRAGTLPSGPNAPAWIDGATRRQAFQRVVLPLARPGMGMAMPSAQPASSWAKCVPSPLDAPVTSTSLPGLRLPMSFTASSDSLAL